MRGDDATSGGVDGIRLCGIYPVMRGGGGVAGLENNGESLCSSRSSYRFSVDMLLSLLAAICSCCITLLDVSNIFMSSSGFSSSSFSASCICFHISYDVIAGGGGGGGGVCGCGSGGDGACKVDIIEHILLPATCSIVSRSSADFSALLIFDCCTASTGVAGGGSFEVRGTI